MVLLQKLKALFGLGESEAEDREGGVTVERDGTTNEAAGTSGPNDPVESEPDETVLGEESVEIDDTEPASEPDIGEESTGSVGAADDAGTGEVSDATDDDGLEGESEAAAAGGSAAGSTGSITEPADSPEEATEPAEAVGPADDDAVPESEADAGADGDEPVDTIKGIGPAYAERLGEAGVETVGDLATADSEDLAGETGIAPTRVQGWIDRAKSR